MAIFKKPILRPRAAKTREMPEGLWTKCPSCGEVIHHLALSENLHVCPKCGHHFTLGSRERIESLVDPDSFQEIDASLTSVDSLQFKGVATYADRLKSYKEKTGLVDAITTGTATANGHAFGLGVMDFSFLAATMGSVVGEKITRLAKRSAEKKVPLILVSTSGGARMQEGVFSLMQMAKTSAAIARLRALSVPYLSILTDPTTGGVSASFAMQGDVILAEPGAVIGFAGQRVIKQTIGQDLPEGFQTAEFLLDHGQIDGVVPRGSLRETAARLLRHMQGYRPQHSDAGDAA